MLPPSLKVFFLYIPGDSKKYKSGIKAINLDDDDKLVGTAITSGNDEILLASSAGKLIRFNEVKNR